MKILGNVLAAPPAAPRVVSSNTTPFNAHASTRAGRRHESITVFCRHDTVYETHGRRLAPDEETLGATLSLAPSFSHLAPRHRLSRLLYLLGLGVRGEHHDRARRREERELHHQRLGLVLEEREVEVNGARHERGEDERAHLGRCPEEDVSPDLDGADDLGELVTVARAALEAVVDARGGHQAVGPRRPGVLAPRQLLSGVGGGDAVALLADGDGAEFAVAAEDGDGVLARRRAQVEREGNDLENEEERVLDSLGEDDGGGGRERTTVSARFEGFLVTRMRLD